MRSPHPHQQLAIAALADIANAGLRNTPEPRRRPMMPGVSAADRHVRTLMSGVPDPFSLFAVRNSAKAPLDECFCNPPHQPNPSFEPAAATA